MRSAFATAALLAACFSLQAAVPAEIHFQGRLTDDAGAPITTAVDITFSLYDVEEFGAPIWTETYAALTPNDGLFSATLGENALNPLTLAIFRDNPRLYLGVQVDADAEMTPRYPVCTSAYAFVASHAENADTLDNLDAIDFASATHNHDADYAPIAHTHDGADIAAGTVGETYIDAAIARDAEVMSIVLATDGSGSTLDADRLDSQDGTFYQNADNINAGTLHTDHYDAYADLGAEARLDNDADDDLVTRLQADSRYVNEGQSDSVTSGMIVNGTVTVDDLQDGTALAEIIDDDGSGSTLDADRLDGLDSTQFADSAHSHSSLDAPDGDPAPALSVDDTGNIGIGTTSPANALSVVGSADFSSSVRSPLYAPLEGDGTSLTIATNNAATGSGNITITSGDIASNGGTTGTVTIKGGKELFVGNSEGALLSIGGYANSNQGGSATLRGGDSWANAGSVYIRGGNAGSSGGGNVTIRGGNGGGGAGGAGNVIIDAGSGGSQPDGAVIFSIDGTEHARLDNAGDVGIGTTSPYHKLHVRDSAVAGSDAGADDPLVVERNAHSHINVIAGPASNSGVLFSDDERAMGSIYYDHSQNKMNFNTSATGPRVVIDSAGNVGIGNPTPDAKLRVDGEVKSVVGGVEFYMVPKGGIIMWSGTVASIPAGWQLCDGTNGTPDLRDRFVLSVGASEDPGATGGSDSVTLTTAELPSHSHTFTTNSAGVHSHNAGASVEVAAGSGLWVRNTNTPGDVQTSDDGAHTHTGTTNPTGTGQPFDNRPAYYKLAFIMKM